MIITASTIRTSIVSSVRCYRTFTKSVLVLSVLSFYTNCCGAQINKIISGDTGFLYNLQKEECARLGIEDLSSSRDSFHFRFWTTGQFIDVWTKGDGFYHGRLMIYTYSYNGDKEDKKQISLKPISQHNELDTATAREAFKLIKNVETIPAYIKGWQNGLDGIEYTLETSTPSTFNFRSYWTPEAQDSSVHEAKKLQAFVNDLDSAVSFEKQYRKFVRFLKPGPYSNGGGTIITKLTPKQNSHYKKTKLYRDYLESVRDTLNQYLSDTLTRLFQKQEKPDCYQELLLKFSKENKLIMVKSSVKLTDKDEEKDFSVCRKTVFAAFKSVKINFVHSHIPFWKKLELTGGEAKIFDTSAVF